MKINFSIKNYSLKKESLILSASIAVITILFVIILSIFTYLEYNKAIKHTYISEANLVSDNINDLLTSLENYMKIIGQQISSLKDPHIYKIADILTNKIPPTIIDKGIFSWTLFDFVNSSNQMIFNSVKGIFNPPIDMSSRKHLKFTHSNPWKIFFSEPVIGNPSGQLVIPVGMGITSESKKFYGTLVAGLSITKLTAKLEQIVLKKEKVFIIVDPDNKVVSKSLAISLNDINELEKSGINFTDLAEGILHKPIYTNQFKFLHFSKMRNTPYWLLLGQNKAIAQAEIIQLIFPLLVELILLCIISILIINYFTNRVSVPVYKLAEAASNIANNKLVNISYSKYSEINILADQLKTINEVKEKLIEANNTIHLNNQLLEQKVMERTKELKSALLAKTEFLNNMSHEIRTPIQGVDGISRGLVIHWHSLSEVQKFEYANQIAKNSARLLSLVGHLLDLAKFTSGKMLLDLQEVDLTNSIKEIIEECKTLYINDRNIRIVLNNNEQAIVVADKERILQVLRNLFVNAIKFSPDDSVIIAKLVSSEITYDNDNKIEGLHFTIIDQGIGIPEEEIHSIFESFTQSSITKTKAGGTGLGLSIVSEIIEAHHGKIWAENNKTTKGANFNFILPLIQAKTMDNHQIVAENDSYHNNVTVSKVATILMIDDEDACLISMELLLKGTNYNLITINGGYQGLDYLNRNSNIVDLMLLDLMMPEIYGLNLLIELKNNQRLANIPVILQSGTSDSSEIDKAYQLGVVSYIKKPYQKQIVLSEIAKALSNL